MSNWYLQNGRDSDVVITSRVRLVRNLNGFKFLKKCSNEEQEKILEKIKEIVPSLGHELKYINLDDLDDITKLSLVEKHLISPEFIINNNTKKAIIVNNEENICIMLNEDDHIKLQVFSSGQELDNLMNLIIEIDEKIGEILNYSYNEKFGYIATSPINIGTGMKASVIVHLPALTYTGNLSKVLRIVNNFGMSVRGLYGEGTQNQGDMYLISNNQTIGVTEKEIIANVKNIAEKVIEQERTARKFLGKNSLELEDRVYRTYGILKYASKMSSDECKKILSDVKLGVDLGIIKELDDGKIKKLELYTKSGNLQKYFGKTLEGYEREIKRAEVIKQIINE